MANKQDSFACAVCFEQGKHFCRIVIGFERRRRLDVAAVDSICVGDHFGGLARSGETAIKIASNSTPIFSKPRTISRMRSSPSMVSGRKRSSEYFFGSRSCATPWRKRYTSMSDAVGAASFRGLPVWASLLRVSEGIAQNPERRSCCSHKRGRMHWRIAESRAGVASSTLR